MTTIARRLFACVSLSVVICFPWWLAAQSKLPVPETRRSDTRDTVHGIVLSDPYRWLEVQNSNETRSWIDAQNKHTDSFLNNLPSRELIIKRLDELTRVEAYGFPTERGGRYFYTKKRPSDEQSILYVRKGLDGKELVFLDPNPLSKDNTISAGYSAFSSDGSLVAYYLRTGGEDEISLRIKDLRTMQELPDSLPRSSVEAISFGGDNRGYYYTLLRPLVGRKIYYHRMGTPISGDSVIFGEGYGPEIYLGPSVSENGRYLLISVSYGGTKNDLFLQDLAASGPIRPVVRDIEGIFAAKFSGDRLFVVTNWKAPNWRVLEVNLNEPFPEGWKEIVSEEEHPIEDFSILDGKLFVLYLQNVISQINVFNLDGNPAGKITLPGIGTASVPYGRWGSSEGFYLFSSFTIPTCIYRYNVATGRSALWSQPKVPFSPNRFETKQVWYQSKDGTKVPMFLVHKKGLKMDSARPTLLTGYGGFNISILPSFENTAVLWAERGGVYAVPTLRGGAEFGESWHRAGMQNNKQNVFDDFIAAAEWLVRNNVTNAGKLGIEGFSNGGLLVGATMTQRPDLCKAVVCGFPLLDMVRYHKFMQGPQWTPEYGSADSVNHFKTLYAYSPYHHVREGVKYPATLFVTGDADTRVAPLHARKMTALLQSVVGSETPILLHYDTVGGHSSGGSTSKSIQDEARMLSFLFWQLGVQVPAK